MSLLQFTFRECLSDDAMSSAAITAASAAGLQWLFFLDSDMTPGPPGIAQLLSHKLDIVAGVYCL